MKPIRYSNLLGQSRTLRSLRLALATPALVLTLTVAAHAGTTAPATAADETSGTNWVGFTIGGAFVNGNDAGMMRRTQTNGDFYGGIDSLQVSQALNKATTLTLDGHAIPGLEDYLGNLTLTNTDIGYVKVGYKQYRTFYDGSGGYMPQLPELYAEPAWGQELHVDRGEFSVEAGLRMENLPEITFGYKHTFRDGNKDSTTWGARPVQQAVVGTTNFEFAPSFWHLDEKSDIFDLGVEHTVGNTDLGLGLNYEHTSYTNSLNTRTGAVTVNPVGGAVTANTQVATTKADDYAMDLFSGNLHSVTRFSDKLWLTAGFACSTVNTNTDGWQQLASPVNPGVLPGSTASTTNRVMPMGGAEFEQYVGNINLMWNPIEDLTITPSFRIEQTNQSALAQMNQSTTTNLGVTTLTNQLNSSEISTNSYSEAIDLRYTGIEDVVLYAKGQWGNEYQTNWYNDSNSSPVTVPAGFVGPIDWLREGINIKTQDYTAGANWYPLRGLSFSLQGFYSERDEALDPSAVNGPGGSATFRPAMIDHDTTTDDVNLRVTWHPLSNLSLVTRYDHRITEYDNKGVRWSPVAQNPVTGVQTPPAGPPSTPSANTNPVNGIWNEVQSGLIKANIVSESVTWMPVQRLYLQASANYTWSESGNNTLWVPDSQNNYWSGSLSVGYAIDNKTDITATYTYYGANNYSQQGSPYDTSTTGVNIPNAMGYGLNTQEHTVSLALTRALAPNMLWNLRYSLMSSQTTGALQDQSGGANDFTAQMISTGLQIRF